MLDVHAPEHRVSGVRDFFVHLLTITVGLLIALGLENAAEALHHRHERKEAEANIHQELLHNRDILREGAPVVQGERNAMLTVIQVLDAISQKKPLPVKQFSLDYSVATLSDGAWRSAVQTGALAYMDYGEVELFADAYKQQAMLEDAQTKTLEDYLELTPLMRKGIDISPAEATSSIASADHALGHLSGVLAVGQGTLDAYNKALQ